MSTPISEMVRLNACPESLSMANSCPNVEEFWNSLVRGDWAIWWACVRGASVQTVTHAACACARLALPYTDNPLVLACIETTERWTLGTATLDEVKAARLALKKVVDIAARAAASAAHIPDTDNISSIAPMAVGYVDQAAVVEVENPALQASIRLQCANIVRSHFVGMP